MSMPCSFPKPNHDPAAARQKALLRQAMQEQRAALTEPQRDLCARRLQRQLLLFLQRLGFGRCKLNLAVYAAFRSELDLKHCWTDLLAWPARLYFPRVSPDADPALQFVPLPAGRQPQEWLLPGSFGVPEPPPAAPAADPSCFSLILVPGLAFDRAGYRLGWGKAYYDRFLASLPNRPTTVGLAYPFQVLHQPLPRQAHDIRLDYLLGPDGWMATSSHQET